MRVIEKSDVARVPWREKLFNAAVLQSCGCGAAHSHPLWNEAAPNIPPVRPSALRTAFSVWGVGDQIQPSIMLRALSIRINLMSLSLHTSASVRPL